MQQAQMLDASQKLLQAAESGRPIAPLTETYPALTVEHAYAIQQLQVDQWVADGKLIIGYKVGLTSEAMQRQLNVDEPDYGFLVEGMRFPNGTVLDLDNYIAPRVEPEIGFVLKKPLRGPGLTQDEVIAAIGTAVPVLEVIDSRIADWKISLEDTIADNASSAGVIVGDQEIPLDAVDINAVSVVVSLDGEEVAAGNAEAVMGSPFAAVQWLANRFGELGVELAAGTLILPGSMCSAVDLTGGSTVRAEFEGLGTVLTGAVSHFERTKE
jgi:2-keto-4-pentenoate hydratase